MKFVSIAITILILSNTVQASEELAQANSCLACHKIDTQLVGPAFQEVAKKYKGQDGSAEALFESIKNGSNGNWGAIPMPANMSVSDEDIKTLVDWILSI